MLGSRLLHGAGLFSPYSGDCQSLLSPRAMCYISKITQQTPHYVTLLPQWTSKAMKCALPTVTLQYVKELSPC